MAAIPAGCERRSALFYTGVAVTFTCVLAIFKDYAANVLRCELLTLFWCKRHKTAFFRDWTEPKKWRHYVTLCISVRIDGLG